MSTPTGLAGKHCNVREGKENALKDSEILNLLKQVNQWSCGNGEIARTFKFQNYHQTMAFVNASAWISHRENHHPDLEVGYNTCRVRYSTHSVGGLSENDFICAAKTDALFEA